MLQVPDHWRAFVARYLEVLDEAADRAPGTPGTRYPASPVEIHGS
jgi:hypothetical protein